LTSRSAVQYRPPFFSAAEPLIGERNRPRPATVEFGERSGRVVEMTMTKADLVDRIYEKAGYSKKDATEVVESIFELLKQRLSEGEKVKISGFGNFVVNEKQARRGRNPQTGDEIIISGRRVLTFKASHVLKNTMNDSAGSGGHD
jgi:integration host factor subunit alpha